MYREVRNAKPSSVENTANPKGTHDLNQTLTPQCRRSLLHYALRIVAMGRNAQVTEDLEIRT